MTDFKVISNVIKMSHLDEHVEHKLWKIIDYLHEDSTLGDIYFMLYKEENKMFQPNYGTEPEFMRECENIADNDGAFLGIVESKKDTFISDFVSDNISNVSLNRFFPKAQNVFALPIFNSDRLFGVILGDSSDDLTELEQQLLSLVSAEITGMITNASEFIELNKHIYELSTLYNITKLFKHKEDISTLCDKIVEHTSTLLYASTVFLEIFSPELEDIANKKCAFNKEKNYDLDSDMIEGIIEDVKRTRGPIIIKNALTDPRCEGFAPDFTTALFAPIVYESSVIGVVGLIDKESNLFISDKSFSEDDLRVLMSLSTQLANIIENAIIVREKERLLTEKETQSWELGILYDVSNAMMKTMKLDNLLHKILTAVTVSSGMGFNRAGLFLVNERMNTLQGMLGIGPDSAEDATRIWHELEKEEKSFNQWLSNDTDKKHDGKSKFGEAIKSIRISLDEEEDTVIKAINNRRPVICSNTSECCENSKYLAKLNSEVYAAIPLLAKDKIIGAIFVDNIITKAPITEESLHFLTLFANQAGLAIENSTLYSNLKKTNTELKEMQGKLLHNEKLAALGEMAADVAHEIRNPLMSIGGFSRRLGKRFEDGTKEKEYTNIITKDVSRLEKILNEILSFSKDERVDNFNMNNINDIVNETLIMFDNEFLANNITVKTALMPDLPHAECDYHQVKQVLVNLVNNSCQAMLNGGTLEINTRKSLLRNEESVVIEVSDTGGGVNNDVIHNIFNPFFTTKDGGTGLGLAITHRLIANHSGSIEVDNNPGIGVTFIINLPINERIHKQPTKYRIGGKI